MLKNALKYIGFAFLVYVIVWSTTFISRPVRLPERTVSLGFPVSFVTIDFSKPTTQMGGAPDDFLRRGQFNITSSWEEPTEVSRVKFLLSYAIVLLFIYGLWRGIGEITRKRRTKSSQ